MTEARRSSCTSTSRGRCGRRPCSRSRGATTTRCPPTTRRSSPSSTDFRDFAHFIEVWILTTNALQTADDFRQVVVDYAAEAAAHGAVYLEGIFSPSRARAPRGRLGRDLQRLLRRRAGGARAARRRGAADADITRGFPLDEAEQVVRYAAAYRDRGVVGVGLGGLEAEFPPEPYEPAFALARELGLASVPHAGEVAGPPSVRGALDVLGADRLRHGIRAAEDPGLLREIADRRIVLDVCPISNLRTGVVRVAGRAPAAAARRRRRAAARSRPTTRRCSAPTSSRDYEAAAELGLDPRDAYEAGLEGALCDEATETAPATRSATPTSGRYPRPAAWPEEPHGAAQAAPQARSEALEERARLGENSSSSRAFAATRRSVYVLLALVFVFSFVLLGVGSGSNGISDALQSFFGQNTGTSVGSQIQGQAAGGPSRRRTSTSTSTSPASTRATTRRRRRSPRCARRGSVAPKNLDVINRIASIYGGQAGRAADNYRNVFAVYSQNVTKPPGLNTGSPLGQALTSDPYSQALQTAAERRVHEGDDRLPEGRGRLQADRPGRAKGTSGGAERALAVGLGRAERQRPRRPRSPPTSGSSRSRPTTRTPLRSGRARAAQKRPSAPASGLDSRAHRARGRMNFDIKTEQLSDDAYVISLTGEVDLYTAPEFKQQLLDVIGKGAQATSSSTSRHDVHRLDDARRARRRRQAAAHERRAALARLQRPQHHEDLRDHRPRPRLHDPRDARRGRRGAEPSEPRAG